MTNFIPLFPLGIVVYPGENLNLHIFEPRYKELIKDCKAGNKPFGIPTVIDEKLSEMGTLVELTEIVHEYENGEMDIATKGLQVFRILEVVKEIPEKLYSGAIVNYPENMFETDNKIATKVLIAVRQLHQLLSIEKKFDKSDESLNSYDVAHHAGLSLLQEYELLELMQEVQRLEYLKRHIVKVMAVMAEIENLKKRVKLNGHFKNLSGFDF